MARAAAKGRRPVTPDAPKRPKKSAPKSYEDTLFFSRLRNHAKWVFVLLAIAFAGGFVVYGVGSNTGGLGDLLNNITGSSSGSSINKTLKKTKEHPNDPKAWQELGQAYEVKGKTDEAIVAWTKVTELQPKSVEGFTRLVALYEGKAAEETRRAQQAALEVQAAQGSSFALPPTTPLGRALAEKPDYVTQAIAATANQRYNDAISERQATLTKLVGVYGKLAKLQPDDPAVQLQLAISAQNAGDAKTAIAAYKRFLKLAPDDPNAVYARQQIKALESQSQG